MRAIRALSAIRRHPIRAKTWRDLCIRERILIQDVITIRVVKIRTWSVLVKDRLASGAKNVAMGVRYRIPVNID